METNISQAVQTLLGAVDETRDPEFFTKFFALFTQYFKLPERLKPEENPEFTLDRYFTH
jgi:hypothetical protein